MPKLTASRRQDFDAGLAALPPDLRQATEALDGKNGETLAFDEAEVWKRVLDFRIAAYLKPRIIIETHRGRGFSARVFASAAPSAYVYSCTDFEKQLAIIPDNWSTLIDIDPFGQPYKAIDCALPHLATTGQAVIMVTNGEMMAVVRNLRHAQHLKTDYKGKDAILWIEENLIPYLEKSTGLQVAVYYAFPTTVRIVLARETLPSLLFVGCPRLMWWLRKPKLSGLIFNDP